MNPENRLTGLGPCIKALAAVAVTLASGGLAAQDLVFSDGFEPFRAELIHRWTFSESGREGTTLEDDVGGANGQVVDGGSRYGQVDFGTLWLTGGSRDDSDYAVLPGFLLSPLESASIEIWGSQDALLPWAHILSAGGSVSNFLGLTWNREGSLTSDRVSWNGISGSGINDAMAPYTLGVEYQIVLTVEPVEGAPGSSIVRLYRDGVSQGDFQLDQVLADLQDDTLWLGRSPTVNQATAAATYNEVRIYDGAMPSEQVAERFAEGPLGDRVINEVTISGTASLPVGEEVPMNGFVSSTDPATPRGIQWSVSDSSVAAIESDGSLTGLSEGTVVVTAQSLADPRAFATKVVTVFPAYPVHLWGFNETGAAGTILRDVVSQADAQVVDVGPNNAVVEDGRVRMTGGAKDQTDYVRLPGFLNFFPDASIELWAAKHGENAWARIFDFGSDELNNLFMSWSQFATPDTDRVEWRQEGTPWLSENDTMGPWEIDREYHIVMTLDADGLSPGQTLVSWYRDGVLKGQAEVPFTISSLGGFFGPDVNTLGRSKYPDETANASYNELRIHYGVMSPAQVAANASGGPPGGVLVRARVTGPAGEEDLVAMHTGETAQFSASVTSTDGAISQSVAWSADNLAVATVDGAGRVTALGPGVGVVRATSLVNGNAKDTIAVEVTDPPRTIRADAAVYDPTSDVVTWFKGGSLTQQTFNQPHPIRSAGVDTAIGSWPAGWGADGVDASFFHPDEDKLYLFKGDEYVQLSPGGAVDGPPKPIVGNFAEWPEFFGAGGVDAVVYYEENNKLYFFKDRFYSRATWGSGIDPGYPRSIRDFWRGWPSSWGENPVDAVMYYPPFKRFFLFRDQEVVAHQFDGTVIAGYPKPFDAWLEPSPPASSDVESDFAAIRDDTRLLSWNEISFPDGWADSRGTDGHIQGITEVAGGQFVISHSRVGDPGFLIVGDDVNGWSYLTDSSWADHPGSIQASGTVVAIPEYKPDGQPQKIRFVHIGPSDYWEDMDHLTFLDDNAGVAPDSVGLVYYPPHEAWWLINGITPERTESKAYPLYKSHRGKSLRDPTNRFVRKGSAVVNGSETGMQLLYDKNSEALYLMTLYRDDIDFLVAPSFHQAVLTRIDLPDTVDDDPSALTFDAEQVAARDDFDPTGGMFEDPSFRWGAGAILDPAGNIAIFATERCIPPNNTGSFAPCANSLFGTETEFFILDQ